MCWLPTEILRKERGLKLGHSSGEADYKGLLESFLKLFKMEGEVINK